MNGHFGLAGPHTVDPGAWLQQQHREREAKNARQERAEAWLGKHLVGQTFWSWESIRYAAIKTTETAYGRPITEDENTVITNAARAIWGGLALRARTVSKIGENGTVEYISIQAA